MHFIHQKEDSIAAIATAPGEGGIAVIRISGSKAFSIANSIFTGSVHKYKTHTAHYGRILDANQHPVDDVLLLVMQGPRSFTGEDTVEIHCHGGSLITRRVLDVVLQAGARQAVPGEFSYRSYLNGKMDLSQAEAVQELISAKSERALDAAEKQLQGALQDKISKFQNTLTSITAIIEAWVDFPEEGLEFITFEEITKQLSDLIADMQHLLDTFHDGKILHDGIALCLVGCPNVGKSSLMNQLLGKDRAIVSQTPGTTRDILEDSLRLKGLSFRLIDTAGIRQTEEDIEKEGIRRSKEAIHNADIIVFVLDASAGLRDEEVQLMEQLPKHKTLALWNKIDLPHQNLPELSLPHTASISAKNGEGVENFTSHIEKLVWKGATPSREEVIITNVRHQEALNLAISSSTIALQGLKDGLSPELLYSDMREALNELGKIIGVNVGEEILSEIFSKFCIGK
jgi:tRNA modification GTPase